MSYLYRQNRNSWLPLYASYDDHLHTAPGWIWEYRLKGRPRTSDSRYTFGFDSVPINTKTSLSYPPRCSWNSFVRHDSVEFRVAEYLLIIVVPETCNRVVIDPLEHTSSMHSVWDPKAFWVGSIIFYFHMKWDVPYDASHRFQDRWIFLAPKCIHVELSCGYAI